VTFIASATESLPLVIAGFAAAALLALVLTPIVQRTVIRLGMVDEPEARRVNVEPVPRAGGLATATAFIVVALAVVVVNEQLRLVPVPTFVGAPELIALLGGAGIAAVIGLIDDYLQLRARWQLVGQVGLAVWAIALGIEVGFINAPLGGVIRLDGWLAIGFTIFWIVGMINSVNFIDGLDGLSTGIGIIAAVTLGVISLTTTIGQPLIAVLCFTLAGALLGFLRWNFHPALAVLGTAKVAVALLVLGVPIIDTFWIIVRRLAGGRAPFSPDRGHIHHRLLDLGLSHTQTVLLIYAICAALALLSLLLSGTGQIYAFLGLFVILGLLLFFLARRSLVAEELTAEAYEEPEPAGPAETGKSTPTPADPSGS
jgi:UDP-GlcNAc:undecaprenyl-phosphate GlcNAc-1-phosphate transferase